MSPRQQANERVIIVRNYAAVKPPKLKPPMPMPLKYGRQIPAKPEKILRQLDAKRGFRHVFSRPESEARYTGLMDVEQIGELLYIVLPITHRRFCSSD